MNYSLRTTCILAVTIAVASGCVVGTDGTATWEEDDTIKTSEALTSFNGSLAGAYASAYYNNPNTHFTDYTSLGGDCTNFVSQSILAGLVQSTNKTTVYNARTTYQDKANSFNDWWYTSDALRATPEWAGANGLFAYLTTQAAHPNYTGLKVAKTYWPEFIGAPFFSAGSIVHKINVSDNSPTTTSWCPINSACHSMVVVTAGGLGQAVVAYRNATGYSPAKTTLLAPPANATYALYAFRISGFQ
jgi:hypothetical protein